MSRFSTGKQLAGLAGWFAVMVVVAVLGAVASINAGTFYQTLTQPAWAPPGSWFGPAWTTLYTLMTVAAWLVWREHGFPGAGLPLGLFLVQLVPNVLWSWLFFAWHLGALSVANILVLWVLIVATTVAFWRAKPVAAVLLVPYLLWVSFAVALNISVWQLNPQLL